MSDRRDRVGFDADHFRRLASEGRSLTPQEAFRQAYETNLWGGAESPSGPGSSLDQTALLRQALPELAARLGVRTLLDLPCGDGHWMAGIDFPGMRYTGADLLPEVLIRARARRPDRDFLELDLTASPLPPADLLLCRDCLVHLSFADIGRAIVNVKRAGITHLLTTTFPGEAANRDIVTGDWRPLNLQAPPFDFPPPLALLSEGCTEGDGVFGDKSLGLWKVTQLPDIG